MSAVLHPTPRFLISHPAHFIALGFGAGLSPYAPGTVGTLVGFPLYALFAAWLAPLGMLGAITVLFGVGVWACERTGRDLGVADHGGMCWDEIVAFMLVLMLTPPGWVWQALAFGAFRLFDIVKPPPIRAVDRNMKGGLGVMFDDILAAFYALLALAIIKLLS